MATNFAKLPNLLRREITLLQLDFRIVGMMTGEQEQALDRQLWNRVGSTENEMAGALNTVSAWNMMNIKNSTWQKIAIALVAISHHLINCRGKMRALTTIPKQLDIPPRAGSRHAANYISAPAAPWRLASTKAAKYCINHAA
jgi:hypothetical protein